MRMTEVLITAILSARPQAAQTQACTGRTGQFTDV